MTSTDVEKEPTTGKQATDDLPLISLEGVQVAERSFILTPQFPLTHNEVLELWQQLCQSREQGAATPPDIKATSDDQAAHSARRLLLLVDRQGSMEPFHPFVDHVCAAIQQACPEHLTCYYFHDTPAEGADETVLAPLSNQLFPALDAVLPQIEPLSDGYLFDDPELLDYNLLEEVLKTHATGARVVLLSDAGAARGRYNLLRLLDTVAFLKALRTYTEHYIWLNPLPRRYWRRSTAAQIARHVPMFPLEREGIYHAIGVLRGQPYLVEKAL